MCTHTERSKALLPMAELFGSSKEVVYLGERFVLLTPEQAHEQLKEESEFSQMLPYLPTAIQSLAGFVKPEGRSDGSPERNNLLNTLKQFATKVLYPMLPDYYGDNTQLCMDLASVMTTYLSQLYNVPVVGKYDIRDSDFACYIRPVTMIFDRLPVYSEHVPSSSRFSVEDAIEIKFSDGTVWVIDFNFWYKHRDGSRLLALNVTDEAGRRDLGNMYGLWGTDFPGFTDAFLPVEACSFFNTTTVSVNYLFNFGDLDVLKEFNTAGFPTMTPDEIEENWTYFRTRRCHPPTFRCFIEQGSTVH
ncbi:hypothetical protein KA012_01625 [Candidatus Woesebacteria bacterium]|nr:hypothetical protein [Candidatus Woesebacteria bacterium]